MKKINLILSFLISIILFISCEPTNVNSNIDIPYNKENDNIKIETLYRSNSYFIDKIIINDTLVNYVMVGHTRKGMVKLN